MSEETYQQKQKEMDDEYEALCRRCGWCCGARDGDPCVNLEKLADGTYFCRVYPNRIGQQKTVSGKSFTCIPIRVVRTYHKLYPLCPYL
jgi:uncharacterized cysteine cluster protein YcgN (CxxCxxCC family)